MPHKRNPITSNRSADLARVVRGNVQPAFEDIALWHERDISHSSVERVILPDSTILVDYLLAKTTQPGGHHAGLSGAHAAQPELDRRAGLQRAALLDLVEAGVLREDAYRIVQRNAMRAWREEKNFRELILADPEITSRVSQKTLERAFDLKRQLRNVDKIFERVFPKVAIRATKARSLPKQGRIKRRQRMSRGCGRKARVAGDGSSHSMLMQHKHDEHKSNRRAGAFGGNIVDQHDAHS